MIDSNQIAQLRARVAGFSRPMLSLYATINPARTGNTPQAIQIRAKNTLKQIQELPEGVADQALQVLSAPQHQGRSVVVFADGEQLEVIHLAAEFPDGPEPDQLEASWGEPNLTPLLMTMDEHAACAVAFAERDVVRIFELSMGRIDELFEAQREPVAAEQDAIGRSKDRAPDAVKSARSAAARSSATASIQKNVPHFVADRSDAAVQLSQEKIDHAQALFYKEAAVRLQEVMDERGIRRLVVMGPQREAHLMFSELPRGLLGQVVAVMPGTASGAAEAQEIRERVEPRLREVEAEKERELLDAVREGGIWGLASCLAALQEGRLHTVAVPRALHRTVFIERSSSYVALAKDEARRLGEDIDEVDLAQHLPELASAYGSRLEFVHGEAEQVLVEELGGMAGLRRW